MESNDENVTDPFFKLVFLGFQEIFSSFSIQISKCQSLWDVSFIFVLLIFGFYCSTVSMPAGSGRFALEMVQEQAILEFYGTPQERESSMRLLKSSCRSLHPARALSCYNLSVLLSSSKNYPEALEYALRARNADPSDSLYRDQVFQVAYHLELEQGEVLSADEVEKDIFEPSKIARTEKRTKLYRI